jgi:Uma2 family endonuclease
VADEYDVRVKATLRIEDYHAREPDLMITRRFAGVRFPAPDDVVMIVEASVSSRARDLDEKRKVYASAGIGEYWVWEAEAQILHVFRDPIDGDYGTAFQARAGDRVAPLFAPTMALNVSDLIPR